MTGGDGALLRPRVLIPFIVVTLIWGSTWIVIKDQLGSVPPPWSVTYRFAFAAAAMFIYAGVRRLPLAIGREGHRLAMLFGVPQFCLNFNFVYAAEQYITSGVVAVVFALLLVPNTAFSWLFLKQRISARFLVGSGVAMVGVGLLFLNEIRAGFTAPGAVLTGIGLTLLGVLSASIANVMQATERLRSRPIVAMLAWGLFYGMSANALIAVILHGAPALEYRTGYLAGLLYLGPIATAFTFTLYIAILREVGPGQAAYSSLLVPIIAMTFSTALEDYHWSTLAVFGCLLALAGLFIALKARKTPAPLPA